MEKYDVVIVGAGIGGLVCGCYLAKQGLKVLILEQQEKCGGYCSSFQRGPYKFDTGVHYLGGVKTGLLGKILSELELKLNINQFDPTDKIVLPENTVYIRANPEDTIKEFKKTFPGEKNSIEKFFRFTMEDNFLDIFSKVKKLTFEQVLNQYFNNHELKTAICMLLSNIGLPANKITALTALSLFREFVLDPGYYPDGSMQSLAETITDSFKAHGGQIRFSQKVSAITTDKGKIKGVNCAKNTINAEIVVSNADATKTFQELLDVKSTPEAKNIKKLSTSSSVFALYLGLKTDLNNILREKCNIWYFGSYNLEEFYSRLKQSITQQQLPGLMIAFPSMHRQNCDRLGCITSLIAAPYESEKFWDKWRDSLQDKMLAKISEFVPQLGKYLDLAINATPLTFERYTSNSRGAIYGWEPTLKQSISSLLPQQTSIENLFLASHWCTKGIGVGCISGVMSMGRNAAKLILETKGYNWQYPLFFR